MANQPITEKDLRALASKFKKQATVPLVSEKLGITQERAKTLLLRAKWRAKVTKTKPYVWTPKTFK